MKLRGRRLVASVLALALPMTLATSHAGATGGGSDFVKVGYFLQWGIYGPCHCPLHRTPRSSFRGRSCRANVVSSAGAPLPCLAKATGHADRGQHVRPVDRAGRLAGGAGRARRQAARRQGRGCAPARRRRLAARLRHAERRGAGAAISRRSRAGPIRSTWSRMRRSRTRRRARPSRRSAPSRWSPIPAWRSTSAWSASRS